MITRKRWVRNRAKEERKGDKLPKVASLNLVKGSNRSKDKHRHSQNPSLLSRYKNNSKMRRVSNRLVKRKIAKKYLKDQIAVKRRKKYKVDSTKIGKRRSKEIRRD